MTPMTLMKLICDNSYLVERIYIVIKNYQVKNYQVIKAKEVKLVKEVKKCDGL